MSPEPLKKLLNTFWSTKKVKQKTSGLHVTKRSDMWMKANTVKAGTVRTLDLCFCFVGAATWTHHAPKVTYHGRAPIGHHGGSSSRRTHLRRHVVEAGIGGTRAGQLTIHARVGHHPKWGGVWARHCQGRPQASSCKEAQATCDSNGSSGPDCWPFRESF